MHLIRHSRGAVIEWRQGANYSSPVAPGTAAPRVQWEVRSSAGRAQVWFQRGAAASPPAPTNTAGRRLKWQLHTSRGRVLAWYSTGGESTAPAVTRAHGFEMVSHTPSKRLWWARKPKDVDDEEAGEALEDAAEVITSTVAEQVAKGATAAKVKKAVKEAIKPVAEQMPGFDWLPLYQESLKAAQQADAKTAQELQSRIVAALKERERLRIEQDEDDLAILAMLL